MYSNTPGTNFLVLSPIQTASHGSPAPRARSDSCSSTDSASSNFLVLSPTQAGPHDAEYRGRSDSSASMDSSASASRFLVLSPGQAGPHHASGSENRVRSPAVLSPSPLPAGFLFLGYDAPVQTASSE
ncbi:uncharacterized protein EURHEDRAFT_399348 [Aspergillus ruber CBS 135680]|uniref:Uncharacterized protein n=1 Tax=Aspergillus ruber (strain CBS 135680) TaxID=1388766 RepID=A0A017SS30_ASPRC|nr:uncharacterized protein EURHEDRAFT_399348 [Aspergillus ruber CBS 135680]EYE99050.1 hypothetical protein EURHEDRAFT_399348 [Aspergillus ruber CBS 135680]